MTKASPEHEHVVISKRLVIANSISSVITRLLNVVVLLWMYQFLLRRISPEEFSIYPVVMAIMGFAPLFFSLFTSGVSRYVIDAYAKGQKNRVSEIVSSMVPLLAGYGLIFLAAGLMFAWYVGGILNIPEGMLDSARVMLGLLLFSFAVQMILLPFGVGFHVKQRFIMLNFLGILRDIFRIMLLFLFLYGIGPSVFWVVVATVVSEFCYLLVMVWFSRKLVPELRIVLGGFKWKAATEVVSFGLWTTLGRLGNIMYTNAATVVLYIMGTALDVTNYYLGATVYRQIHGTISIALVPVQPTLTAMNALEDYSRLSNTFLRGGRYALWISLVVACPVAIYSEELVLLYVGERFLSASQVIMLFVTMFPFTHATVLLPMTAMATAKHKPFYVGAFGAQVVGLLLMLYFVGEKEMGAFGATLALVVITVGSQLAYFWPLSCKIAKIPARRFFYEILVPGYAPAIAAAFFWVALRNIVQPSSWWVLLSCITAGGIFYVAVLAVFCLSPGEKREIRLGLKKKGLKKGGIF